MELDNKVAILIGLNDVGIAVAKGLLNEGAAVAVSDTDQTKIDIIAEYAKSVSGKILGVICDVTKTEQVQSLIQKTLDNFKKIDILITNFWDSKSVPFIEVTEEFFSELLDKNLKSAFRCVRATVPIMKNAKYGKIIHILPLVGYTGSTLNEVPLSTASAALMGLTRAVAMEGANEKIRVNAVAIPLIDSKSFHEIYTEDLVKKTKDKIPLGEICQPKDVVGPVIFLASNRSDYITGEIMIISGGSYTQ